MFRLSCYRIASAVFVFSVCATCIGAQTKGQGSIAGTVTLGGKLAKGVPVVAWVNTVLSIPKPQFNNAMTDDEGRYIITGLSAGSYQVAPYRPANTLPERTIYDAGSKSVTINENEAITGVDFSLAAGAVVTGRVTGLDGRPLIEQRITIEAVEGKMSYGGLFGNEMYRTDDRGIYRIYGLPAGRYTISVGEAINNNAIIVGLNSKSYVPRTFYPSVTEKSEAKVLELTDGSVESGIDIAVGAPEKSYSISGRMIDQATDKPVADVPAAFGLVGPTGSIGAFGTSSNSDSSGQFKLNSLKPGKYAVFAGGFSFGDSSDKWTSDPVVVEITDADVTDIEIKVRIGVSVDGNMVVEGTSDPEVLRKIPFLRIQIYSASPSNPGTIQTPSGRSTQPAANGKFHIEGISPGRYNLYVSQTGAEQIFTIWSVEQDGNITNDGVLDISQGIDHVNVRLVLETGNGTIRGQLNIVGGELPGGMILSGAIARSGQSRLHSKPFSVDARGRFVVEHLAAGEYEIQVTAFSSPGQSGPPRPVPAVRQSVTISGSGETTVTMTLDLTPRPGGTQQ